jgi:hypothetical protein
MLLPYQYQALQSQCHIRLMKISPNLTFDLVTVNLEHAPPYEAVSYVWGTGPQDTHLTVGDLAEGYLAITEILWASLQYLFSAATNKYLWIDQICMSLLSLVPESVANAKLLQVSIKMTPRRRVTRFASWERSTGIARKC